MASLVAFGRRWNGWGDASVCIDLPEDALAYLRERLGESTPPHDAPIDDVIAAVAPSRLPPAAAIDTTPLTRLQHARGQSLPDWLALRFGRIERVPDGVAFPESSDEVASLLEWAKCNGARVIPYGGGTSVVGHINPPPDVAEPILTISLSRMRRLLDLDEESGLATFEAGATGPDLEAQLHVRGYTLRHFPQSFEYSTLGGWIATRSSGQESLGYGAIDDMLAGARVETPRGTLRIPTVPASAAGIDLRELILGSEGRVGIVTEATVRVRALPEREAFVAWFLPSWEPAEATVRALVDSAGAFTMIRLANAQETSTALRFAGGGRARALLDAYLRFRGVREERCLLLVGTSGSASDVHEAIAVARAIAGRNRGVYAGAPIGERWRDQRFRSVYLRNTLWERGYAVDTAETSVDWPRVRTTMYAMENAARACNEEPIHAYSHLSHVYRQGSSVYSTFVFRIAPTFEANLRRWEALKRAISEAVVANGGTISHQHGVGIDHKAYLAAEKGALGLDAMRAVFREFDPDGIMNPGKLV